MSYLYTNKTGIVVLEAKFPDGYEVVKTFAELNGIEITDCPTPLTFEL
jgi:effector-binding domain-containing protein